MHGTPLGDNGNDHERKNGPQPIEQAAPPTVETLLRTVAEIAPFLFRFSAAERAYGPDLFVADESAFESEDRHADGAALSLVGEFTSVSTRDADWNEKLDVYGRLVPIYLVVDMQDSEITCFWEPSPHGYRSRTTVSFGEALHVPAPFGFAIDTTGF